jgi:Ala-tRNA(Pro) deacylase
VKDVPIRHAPAFTAQEIAALAHIPGTQLAKPVIVKLDGQPAVAVLPATDTVHVEKAAAGARTVVLANAQDFQDRFPGCDVGAMLSVGNLYGLDVRGAARFAEDEAIAFNAGGPHGMNSPGLPG